MRKKQQSNNNGIDGRKIGSTTEATMNEMNWIKKKHTANYIKSYLHTRVEKSHPATILLRCDVMCDADFYILRINAYQHTGSSQMMIFFRLYWALHMLWAFFSICVFVRFFSQQPRERKKCIMFGCMRVPIIWLYFSFKPSLQCTHNYMQTSSSVSFFFSLVESRWLC